MSENLFRNKSANFDSLLCLCYSNLRTLELKVIVHVTYMMMDP